MSKRSSKKTTARKGKKNTSGLRDTAPLFRAPSNLVHHHVRTIDLGALAQAAADKGYGNSFALSSVSGSTEFTNLYDSYRMDMVEVIWELDFLQTGATANQCYPTIIAWPDYDDATAPSTLAAATEIAQSERFQMSPLHVQFKRSIKPKVALELYDGAAPAAAGSSRAGVWVDCATPGIPHYGVKYWIKNYNSTTVANCSINLSLRLFMSLRNPR